jgi:hypothetical protein
VSIQAGGFTPFVMTMSREDGEQPLRGIALHMPKGVSGTLSTVKLCGEQQADEGTCGPESLIGETIVSVGVGGDPKRHKGKHAANGKGGRRSKGSRYRGRDAGSRLKLDPRAIRIPKHRWGIMTAGRLLL